MGDVTPTKSPGGAKSAPSSLPKPIFIAEPLNFSTKKVKFAGDLHGHEQQVSLAIKNASVKVFTFSLL